LQPCADRVALAIVFLLTSIDLIPPCVGAATMPHGEAIIDVPSPPYDNQTDSRVSVWSYEVPGGVGTWTRVHFNKFRIGPRDFVRLTGSDGQSYEVLGVQVDQTAGELGWGEYFSLFFNGSWVLVELFAEPSAEPGHLYEGVNIDFVHYGLVPDDGGVGWQCTGFPVPEASSDWRVGRLIVFREDEYTICSATALYTGSCILTDGNCLLDGYGSGDADLTKGENVIVEFGVPNSLPDPFDGTIQHADLDEQYRLMTGVAPCVDPPEGVELPNRDYAVYVAAPNEKTGYSHGECFTPSALEKPIPGDAIIVESFPEQPVTLNHTQIRDSESHSIDVAMDDGTVLAELLCGVGASVGNGSEGGPLVSPDLRTVYGLANEPACFGCFGDVQATIVGTSFDAVGLDPDNDTSCVNVVCDDPREWVDYVAFCMTEGSDCSDEKAKFDAVLNLPNATLDLSLDGTLREKGSAPILRYDNRFEIDTELTDLNMSGVSCVGPVSFRLSSTKPSTGLIRQISSSALFPAESDFEVFLEVDVAGITLTNQDPIRFTSVINSIPAYGVPYVGPTTAVTLYGPQGGVAGTLDNVRFTIDPARECQFSGIQLVTDVYGTLSGNGTVEWLREATVWDDSSHAYKVPYETVALDLRGMSPPAGGPYIVRESSTRQSRGGVIIEGTPHELPISGTGFVDMYFEIELPQLQRTLYNRDALRLEAAVTGPLPNESIQSMSTQGPVVLYDRDTEQPIATLFQAAILPQTALACTPPPPPGDDGFCASGRLVVDLGQGPLTIDNLAGNATLRRGAAMEQADGLDVVPTEMLSLALEASASPIGPVDISLEPHPEPVSGEMRQLSQGQFFPAESGFDLRIRIASTQGVLHNPQPFHIETEINSLWDVAANPYSGVMTGIQLVDQNGVPRGSLLLVELQPEVFYDPQCPVVLPCGQTLVGVEPAEANGAGARVTLHEPMPNPFAGSVRIAFDLPRGGDASLRIYDVSGRRVRTLIESRLPAQIRHDLTWDGTDQDGRPVSTGIYFVRLEADGKSFTRRAVVLR
jgi:hypothetical protein